MDSDVAGALIALVAVAIGLGIYYLADRRQKAKKKALDDNVVGPEVLQLEAGGIASAFPVQLFKDDNEVSVTINKVTGNLVAKVHTACKKAVRQGKPLRVIINSTGGDVITARTIAGLLQDFIKNGHEVFVVVMGKCYSAGMIILMAVEPEYRLAVTGSEFLIHATKTGERKRTTRTFALDDESADTISAGSLIERSSLRAHFKSGKDCLFSVDDAHKMNVVGGTI